MEQALFVSKVDNLKYFEDTDEFARLYFGMEFCERLILSVDELQEVVKFVNEKKIDFTLVTPYVTEDGQERVVRLLRKLNDIKPSSEVVFNDWGVF